MEVELPPRRRTASGQSGASIADGLPRRATHEAGRPLLEHDAPRGRSASVRFADSQEGALRGSDAPRRSRLRFAPAESGEERDGQPGGSSLVTDGRLAAEAEFLPLAV